jgi:hypothetical protein
LLTYLPLLKMGFAAQCEGRCSPRMAHALIPYTGQQSALQPVLVTAGAVLIVIMGGHNDLPIE